MMKGKAVAIPGLRNKLIPIAARLAPRPLIAELSHRAARPTEEERNEKRRTEELKKHAV